MRTVSRRPNRAVPARIAPLSVLPVFLDLAGRPVLVAGGTDAAAWKAELLAAAGATVHVHAPASALGGEMRRLLDGKPKAGRIVHHDAVWRAAAIAGMAVAVADADDDGAAAEFALAAKAAGVPCNVIDRPRFCGFQFGSIVNRSPVVIEISTTGAAPILGQAIRRRIEGLLPPALADWAGLAATLRAVVNERLAQGGERGAFWNRFVGRAFGPPPSPAAREELIAEIEAIAGGARACRGVVTFVGCAADAELLTLKAVRALQSADVILADASIAHDVLELARREAKRILVGGHGGGMGEGRGDVVATMAALARDGRRVVRLRRGDPAAGALDGEIAGLRSREIPLELIPGVPASPAMPGASDGAPSTAGHRWSSARIRAAVPRAKRPRGHPPGKWPHREDAARR